MKSLHDLDAEEARLLKKRKRLGERIRTIEDRLYEIENEKHRLTIVACVGKQVRIRCRYPAGHRCHKLNDAIGTLVSAKRTRASVDFGEHGKWTWPIDELLPGDCADLQGFIVGVRP